jgi:hypothetical protein
MNEAIADATATVNREAYTSEVIFHQELEPYVEHESELSKIPKTVSVLYCRRDGAKVALPQPDAPKNPNQPFAD